MSAENHSGKSGQAIIFLLVVLVIGVLVVIWNFDVNRVISAKLRMRNAADAAAMAGARWQGHTLNMIGDLNLIQAALMSQDPQGGASAGWQEMHELRSRLQIVGPLGAYAVAQQAAFNNGAVHDPVLASNLFELAMYYRDEVIYQPYPNAYEDYADLLDNLSFRGVAVSSYGLRLPSHPLVQEGFYSAIAMALTDWWCPMKQWEYLLKNYSGVESWGKLDTEFYDQQKDPQNMAPFNLKLEEFEVNSDWEPPDSAIVSKNNFDDDFQKALDNIPDNPVSTSGDPSNASMPMLTTSGVLWHAFKQDSWSDSWPRLARYEDLGYRQGSDRFPFRERVKDHYNYLGAEAGVCISAPVHRGILSSSDNTKIDLSYKAKAKPFGFIDLSTGGPGVLVPPHYFGFVLPVFQDVRLIHSDIGDRVLSGEFYEHITKHLEAYLAGGPEAGDPECRYCRLLAEWEVLNKREGLEWLERAYRDEQNNPCEPELEDDMIWEDAGGGASGGS